MFDILIAVIRFFFLFKDIEILVFNIFLKSLVDLYSSGF